MDEALRSAGIAIVICGIYCMMMFATLAIGSLFGDIGIIVGFFVGIFVSVYISFKFMDWAI